MSTLSPQAFKADNPVSERKFSWNSRDRVGSQPIQCLGRDSKKRAKAAGFLTPVGCHTWRATGITIYLENDGRFEHAQQMAGHESPRTTKLYDRTKDEITLSEVERIRL
jgi:integrase